MSEHVVNIGSGNFEAEVMRADIPVLISFWAEWCGPCHAITPTIVKLASEYAGRVRFVKVDVDANQDLADRFEVRGLPTLLLLKNGAPLGRVLGAQSRSMLATLLDKHVVEVADEQGAQPRRFFQAFHADADLKSSVVNRVRRLIADDKIDTPKLFLNFDDSSDRYTLLTAAVPTADPEVYEKELGIPSELARLEESVHGLLMREVGAGVYAFRGESAHYPVDWLQALPPGKDLQRVVPMFLDWWLHDLANVYLSPVDDAAAEMAKLVAGLHARVARGDLPTRREWKSARHRSDEIMQQMEEIREGTDIASHMLLSATESLAWPPEELGSAIAEAIGSTFMALTNRAFHSVYSKEEWSKREALAAAMHERMKTMLNPTAERMREDADVRAYDEFIGAMRPREYSAGHEAKYAYGERLHLGLMRVLESA